MIRFTCIAAALSILAAAPASADLPATERQARPAEIEPAVADPGAILGARLEALGTFRPLGDDFDLAIRGLFRASGAESFRRWRTTADTLAEAADKLPLHRIVVVARASSHRASAVSEAEQRARAFVDALTARGVEPARITTEVAARDPGGVELQIRFERRLAGPPIGS